MKNDVFKKSILSLFFLIMGFNVLSSQNYINAPIYNFKNICASEKFNSYKIEFSFSFEEEPNNRDNFRLQLSDANGNFNSPVNLTASVTLTTNKGTVEFSLPPNTIPGKNYKLRVVSNSPEVFGTPGESFFANYALHNQGFNIEGDSDVTICGNEPYTLKIKSGLNSPLQHKRLTYIWYKGSEVIPEENGSELKVTEAGEYYVGTDYGLCGVMDSYSNSVKVSKGTTVSNLTLSSPSTKICPGNPVTLTSNVNNSEYTYQWYLGDQKIDGAVNAIYEAREAGVYYLVVTSNSCDTVSENTITLTLETINAVLDVPKNSILLSRAIKKVTVTTDAVDATFEWYKGNSLLSVTINTLLVNEIGAYKVIVKQISGCQIEEKIDFNIELPTDFEVSIAAEDGYEESKSSNVTLEIKSLRAKISAGLIDVDRLDELGGAISYQWYKDEDKIDGEIFDKLDLKGETANGSYKVVLTIEGFDPIFSNEIRVTLIENKAVIVPNVISPNGDGINDTWMIPNEYAYQENVEVIIINSNGIILYQGNNYQNDWPQTTIKANSVVYYRIIKDNKVAKQGSITILK